jgi:hypothetical protein
VWLAFSVRQSVALAAMRESLIQHIDVMVAV